MTPLINVTLFYSVYKSPFGLVGFIGSEEGLMHLGFYRSQRHFKKFLEERYPEAELREDVFSKLTKLLNLYFKGIRVSLDYPLILSGSEFQLKVWEKVREIGYGEVRSYGWIAKGIRMSKAARAVGRAVASNPVALIIPCHRVIRSDGTIGGFGYGVSLKRKLLKLEGVKI